VPPIPSSALVCRRDQPLTNELSDNETVMMDTDRGRYYGVRDVGKVIWEHLASPTTIDGLCRHLLARFDVDAETCRREVGGFIDELHKQGLLEIHDAKSTS
jgi:hypothetical protein